MITHKYFKCQCGPLRDHDCQFCDDALEYCTVCGAGEGELLSSCPGFKLNSSALNACYKGNVYDFILLKNLAEAGFNLKNKKW